MNYYIGSVAAKTINAKVILYKSESVPTLEFRKKFVLKYLPKLYMAYIIDAQKKYINGKFSEADVLKVYNTYFPVLEKIEKGHFVFACLDEERERLRKEDYNILMRFKNGKLSEEGVRNQVKTLKKYKEDFEIVEGNREFAEAFAISKAEDIIASATIEKKANLNTLAQYITDDIYKATYNQVKQTLEDLNEK